MATRKKDTKDLLSWDRWTISSNREEPGKSKTVDAEMNAAWISLTAKINSQCDKNKLQ